MKRITLEETKDYIALDNKEVNEYMHRNKITHYSLDPHPNPKMAKKGWQGVTYYIPKKNLEK